MVLSSLSTTLANFSVNVYFSDRIWTLKLQTNCVLVRFLFCLGVWVPREEGIRPALSNSPLAQLHGTIPPMAFLPAPFPSSLISLVLLLISPPCLSSLQARAPRCLQLSCTGLLIGDGAAAHLLIESRLGPWGRAVKQAPRGIKSWRLTGLCKSRAANSHSVYQSVLEWLCFAHCEHICMMNKWHLYEHFCWSHSNHLLIFLK